MEFVHLLDMLVQTGDDVCRGDGERGGAAGGHCGAAADDRPDCGAGREDQGQPDASRKQAILTNTMFQLRMTYMEIVNMIDRQAMQKAPGAPGAARK